jgi:hypothetical protein
MCPLNALQPLIWRAGGRAHRTAEHRALQPAAHRHKTEARRSSAPESPRRPNPQKPKHIEPAPDDEELAAEYYMNSVLPHGNIRSFIRRRQSFSRDSSNACPRVVGASKDCRPIWMGGWVDMAGRRMVAKGWQPRYLRGSRREWSAIWVSWWRRGSGCRAVSPSVWRRAAINTSPILIPSSGVNATRRRST